MNEELFTAHDARKRSEDSLLASTIQAIKEAARGGNRSTTVTVKGWQRQEIEDSLEARGFNVTWEYGESTEECTIFIDWNP